MAATPTAVPKYEQRSILQFLIEENIFNSEIHTRMCVVYDEQNVITKSTVNQWVQRVKAGQTSASDEPRIGTLSKRRTWSGKLQASANLSLDCLH